MRAAALGAATGLRSMMGAAWWTHAQVRAGTSAEPAAVARWVHAPVTARTFAAAAAGELVADKLPSVPARVRPGPLAARAVLGGLLGWGVARREGGQPALCAATGVVSAVSAAFAGYHLRRRITRAGMADPPVALAEDALAVVLAATGARAGARRRMTQS